MKFRFAFLGAIALSAQFAAAQNFGSLHFADDSQADGIDCPAGTTIQATSWPTQILVRPVVPAGKTLYSLRISGGYYTPNVAPGGVFSDDRFPMADGSIFITPPYGADSTITIAQKYADDVYWVDAANGSDSSGDGSEALPWKTLQHAVDQCNTSYRHYVILAKPGDYREGGVNCASLNAGDSFTRVGIPADRNILIKSTHGAASTFISGAPDLESCPDAPENVRGCGPLAYRCVTFHANGGGKASVQGFTLRNGHSGLSVTVNQTTGAVTYGNRWALSDTGGAVLALRPNFTISQHQLLDCRIVDCKAKSSPGAKNCHLVRCECDGLVSGTNADTFNDGSYLSASLVKCAGANSGVGVHVSAAGNGRDTYNSCLQGGRFNGSKFYGTVTAAMNGSDGTPVGLTVSPAFWLNQSSGDWRIAKDSAADGNTQIPAKDSADWNLWTTYYTAMAESDFHGNRLVCRERTCPEGNAVLWPVSGAIMEILDTVTVNVSTSSWSAAVTLAGCSQGENRFVAGDSFTIAPAHTGTRFAAGVVVKCGDTAVTNFFADCPDGVLTVAIPDNLPSGASIAIDEAILSNDWYADPVNGSDSNTGFTQDTALRTLAATADKCKTLGGNRILALPGTYAEGTQRHSMLADEFIASRVVLPQNVTLESVAGPESTILLGASATPEGGPVHETGCGSNAVRCAYLRMGSRIKGFTITGGRTCHIPLNDHVSSGIGGGVLGDYTGANPPLATVENCIVSNNCSLFSGAGMWCRFVGCRITGNRAFKPGFEDGTGWNNSFESCIVGTSGSTVSESSFRFYDVVNSTFLQNARLYECVRSEPGVAVFANNICLGPVHDGRNPHVVDARNCIFSSAFVQETYVASRTDCLTLAPADVLLDADGVPAKGSPAIDAGFNPSVAANLDASLSQRIWNGTVDIGAFEFDFRPDASKALHSKDRFAVLSASPEVEIADGGLLVPSGARVAGPFANPKPSVRGRIIVLSSTSGAFEVIVNGETVLAAATVAGTKLFEFPVPPSNGEFEIVCTGDSSVMVNSIGFVNGLCVIVR